MKLIHPLIILRIIGTILLIETFAFLFCLPVALIYRESMNPFLLSALVTGFLYSIIRVSTIKTDTTKFSNRDGYMAVTISWIVFIFMGGLPYLFSGVIPSINDAFFESASGFTTTGSTIIKDVEILPFSIHFWRSLTHWIGGIGIIVLVIIILPRLKVSGYQLFSLESSLKERIHPKTQGIAFRMIVIYLGLTVAQIILLVLGDMTLFDSICHTFSTVATGGFSTRNASITYYSTYSQYIITVFMFLSGVSFVIYYYLIKFQFSKVRDNEELWFYTGTTIIAGVLCMGILFGLTDKSVEVAFREGFFQVVSVITTTGFINADYLYWPPAAILLLFILLFAGASTGSSTGSIKMVRHLIALKNIKNVFTRLNHPNVITQIKVNRKPISEKANHTIISFIILYLFIFLIGTVIITLTGLDPLTASSAVASSMGNVGPGLGLVGPMFNYADLPAISKLIFSLLMIIGRLEILTVFALFSKSFWKL